MYVPCVFATVFLMILKSDLRCLLLLCVLTIFPIFNFSDKIVISNHASQPMVTYSLSLSLSLSRSLSLFLHPTQSNPQRLVDNNKLN